MWFAPGPSFGYTVREIDGHPWNYLLTMKELCQLEPGTIRFTGEAAASHIEYWKQHHPEFFPEVETAPVFVVDTTPVHPRTAEQEPRRPFAPWKKAN
ncbi:MAG: hypothetical protein AAGK14_03280 [Verrucomicrobiota bacterium]